MSAPGRTRKARKLRTIGVGPHAKLLPPELGPNHVVVPLRLASLANASQREHWTVKHKRTKAIRSAVSDALTPAYPPRLPCSVRVTRIAPRAVDGHDNLPSACKNVVDQVAEWLGVDDRDPRVKWEYAQARAGAREYGVRIEWRSA